MVCSSYAAENKEGAKFCSECGTPLARRCPVCGSPHRPGQKFCDECGRALAVAVAAPVEGAASTAGVPELRFVSVLFVDLVALEVVDAVSAFGEEVGAPDLRARAGVVTGQVAAVANPGEGIVVGDRVNTASRVQSAAQPGTVLVDDATRQVSAAAVLFEDVGEHEVKGKAEPIESPVAS